MNPEVFREYDIRGVVGTDLDEEFVERLSRALGVYFHDHRVKRISLGMDARLSSPLFKEILKKGLTQSGIEVVAATCCGRSRKRCCELAHTRFATGAFASEIFVVSGSFVSMLRCEPAGCDTVSSFTVWR